MKKTVKIILGTAVIVAIAGGIVYGALASRKPSMVYNSTDAIGNTPGNLANGGRFAESDGVIYFANPYDNDSLYTMTSDCSNVKEIAADTASCINVCGNYVYYVKNNYNEDNGKMLYKGDMYGVMRTDLNGKNDTIITNSIATDMVLYGNTLIYTEFHKNEFKLHQVSIDGSGDKVASKKTFPLCGLYAGNIYYSGTDNSHGINSYSISNNIVTSYLDGNTYKATMSNGILYYIDLSNKYALTKYDPVTKQKTVLSKDFCINYNVYNDIVFYVVGNENACLKRIHTDGSQDEVIISGNIENVSCTSKYTFFNYYNTKTLYRVPTTSGNTVEMIRP